MAGFVPLQNGKSSSSKREGGRSKDGNLQLGAYSIQLGLVRMAVAPERWDQLREGSRTPLHCMRRSEITSAAHLASSILSFYFFLARVLSTMAKVGFGTDFPVPKVTFEIWGANVDLNAHKLVDASSVDSTVVCAASYPRERSVGQPRDFQVLIPHLKVFQFTVSVILSIVGAKGQMRLF